MMREIGAIEVGIRHRKDMGDVAALAESIRQVGLLHPIVVTPNGCLVAGERRLSACKLLGWSEVPVSIVDLTEIARGEFAENAIRKDFLPSEMVAIKRTLEPILATPHGGDRKSPTQETFLIKSESFALDPGKTTTKVAAYVGVSDRTLEKAEAVVKAAEAEPERFAPLVAEMDRTGKVDGAFRKLKQAETDAIRAASVLLPDGCFDVIIMDPPWPMEKIEREVRPNQVVLDYPVMTEDELLGYGSEIEPRVAQDCHFFLWTTHKFLPMALRLLEEWDFRYVCTFVWHKPGGFQPIGLPQYNCEFVLYARRGTPRFVDTKAFSCCFEAARREHSRKPDEFYELVARVTHGRRADWFARATRDGFEVVGNETGKFDVAAA